MQAIPQKKSVAIHFAKPLAAYIQNFYQHDPATLADQLCEFDELRATSISATPTPGNILQLVRYLAQLRRLSTRFPIRGEDDGIKITFSWFNFAGVGREKKPVASFNAQFEEAAILFNVGALYSQLGAAESLDRSESLRKACNYFLLAAGVFEALPREYPAKTLGVPTGTGLVDVADTQLLEALQTLMLAQAQECFVLKAILERNVKDVTLAKLAYSTSAFYEIARNLASNQTILGSGSELVEGMIAKAAIYRAIAHHRKAAEFLAVQAYGKEIVKLQEADEALKPARDMQKRLSSSLLSLFNQTSTKITQDLERAKRDNQLIYHEVLPQRGDWASCGSAIVVRPAAFPDSTTIKEEWEGQGHAFLFESLPSLSTYQTLNQCNQMQDALIREITAQVEQAWQAIIVTTFQRLNLPEALEALEVPVGVPDVVRQKSAQIRSLGGIVALEEKRNNATELRAQCLRLYREMLQQLEEEENMDGKYRQMYSSRWTRPPSTQLNTRLRNRLEELAGLLKQGESTDQQVLDSYDCHLPALLALCSEEESELEDTIPASSARTLGYDVALLEEIRGTVDQRAEWTNRRDALLDTLRTELAQLSARFKEDSEQTVDYFQTVLTDYSKSFLQTQLSLFTDELAEYCRRLERQMEEFQASLAKGTSASSTSLGTREEALRRLDEAYESFQPLLNGVTVAIGFYSDMVAQLDQSLRPTISDWVSSRTREAEALKMRLDAEMAASGTTAATMVMPEGYAYSMAPPPTGIQPGAWNPNMPIQYASQPYGRPPSHPYPMYQHAQPPQIYHQQQPQPYPQMQAPIYHPQQVYHPPGQQPFAPPQYQHPSQYPGAHGYNVNNYYDAQSGNNHHVRPHPPHRPQ